MLSELVNLQNPWWRGNSPAFQTYPQRRDAFEQLAQRLFDQDPHRRRVDLLVGGRGLGKTVLLEQLTHDLLSPGRGIHPGRVLLFDFSDERIEGPIPSPIDVIACAPEVLEGRFLLFDEVQLAPHWDRWLKRTAVAGGVKVLATGSSALRLRAGSRESGIFRWDEIPIEGLTYREFRRLTSGESGEIECDPDPFAFERYLSLGGYPVYAHSEPGPEQRRVVRQDIVDRSIYKDLLATGKDVTKSKDLFLYLARNSGAQFSLKMRAEDLEWDQRTVRDHLRLLEDASLVRLVAEYPLRSDGRPRTARAQLRPNPKVYAGDHGLVVAFSHAPAPMTDPDTRARMYETVVLTHLRWACRALEGQGPYFYRAKRGALEVDFVFDHPQGRIGIEVTTSEGKLAEKARKLAQAAEQIELDRLLLVGPRVARSPAGVEVVALESFLLDPLAYLVPHG